ncbi:MAG: FAD-binding oxidoreductase [Bacteroidota bacterium]
MKPTKLQALVKAKQAIERKYEANLTEYPSPSIAEVREATSIAEVQQVLHEAQKRSIPVYPISTGRNWGLGSALPITKQNILLNLGPMNRIREVNPRLRYAIIEPGVTQGDLYQHLKKEFPQLIFPMTGSGINTSVIGNMLERGVCVRGHRYKYLLGVEVVLADGTIIRVGGHWHETAKNPKHKIVYAPGIGPDLRGLFTQSNMGVVTAMVVQLEKRKSHRLMGLIAPEANLAPLTDALFALREENIIQDGLLLTVYKDPRTSAGQQMERGHWFSNASINGSQSMQEAAMLEIRHRLGHLCDDLRFYRSDQMPTKTEPEYLTTIAKMYQGEPTNYALETMAKLGGVELKDDFEIDQNRDVIGFVCALPAVPFESSVLVQLIDEIDRLSNRLNVQAFYNFVGMTPTALEGFFRVFFDRNDKRSISLAHQWNAQVHELLAKLGLQPYRANVQQMADLYQDAESNYWSTIVNIKNSLDPNHLIAPGRYCPPPPPKKTQNT